MHDLAPAIAMSVMFLSLGAAFVLRGPLGKALADRLAGRAAGDDVEVRELRAEVERIRVELAEMQERLDFTERMISGARERGALGAGGRR